MINDLLIEAVLYIQNEFLVSHYQIFQLKEHEIGYHLNMNDHQMMNDFIIYEKYLIIKVQGSFLLRIKYEKMKYQLN